MKKLNTWPHARHALQGTPGVPRGVMTLGWSQFVVVAVVVFAALLLMAIVWPW
jgi:hypothetical protein